MNAGIKDYIDRLFAMLRAAAHALGKMSDSSGFSDLSLKIEGMCRLELAAFMLYLSSSDGSIDSRETDTIAYYTGVNFTPQQALDYIRAENIYSVDFENRVPAIIELLVTIDNLPVMAEFGVDVHGSELLLNAYQLLGEELMETDGSRSPQEQIDFDTFIGNIKKYIGENLHVKDAGSATTDRKGSVQAPAKGGVQAPEKG